MLGQKKSTFNKEGLWYNMNPKRKYFKKLFCKAIGNYPPSVKCNHCGTNGHLSHACFSRKPSNMKTNWKSRTIMQKDPFKNGYLSLFVELWILLLLTLTIIKFSKSQKAQAQSPEQSAR